MEPDCASASCIPICLYAPEGWGDADMGGQVRFWEYISHRLDVCLWM